jgi:hypothetical protein
MLNVVMLSIAKYAFMLSVAKYAFMLSVIMLNGFMLNVVASKYVALY